MAGKSIVKHDSQNRKFNPTFLRLPLFVGLPLPSTRVGLAMASSLHRAPSIIHNNPTPSYLDSKPEGLQLKFISEDCPFCLYFKLFFFCFYFKIVFSEVSLIISLILFFMDDL